MRRPSFRPIQPLVLALASLGAACSSTQPTGTIQLVVGADGNPFTIAPAPATFDVSTIDSQGNAKSIAHGAVGTASIDLGDHDLNEISVFRVTASDASGKVLVWGQSLPVQLGGLDGATLPLFVQRTGGLAQMPGALGDGRPAPLLAIAGGRYVFAVGGSDPSLGSRSQIYDLLDWTPLGSPPNLPRTPRSLAMVGLAALLIDDTGASWLDLTGSSTIADPAAPSGGAFADVAGGATVVAPDGTAYVVGATRTTGAATARVLQVSTTGTLTFLTLQTPRLGAAAAWIPNRGLFVAGGSASGSGAELFALNATAATAVPYPSDAIAGAAMAALPSGHAVLVGGLADAKGASAPTRELDPACTASCVPTAWAAASIPSPAMALAQATALDASTLLVVGEDATGATHASRITPTLAQDVPLKVARNHARSIVIPNGAVAIVGGSGVIESYVP